jgi:hypothetical protein
VSPRRGGILWGNTLMIRGGRFRTWGAGINILILLAASAIMGLVIGLKYSVFVIGLSAPVLAAVAAIVLREFDFVPAAAITFACLAVSQVTYLIGAWLRIKPKAFSDRSLNQQAADHSDDERQNRSNSEVSLIRARHSHGGEVVETIGLNGAVTKKRRLQ